MREFIVQSTYFGVVLTLATYFLGMAIKKKFKFAIFNPLLLSIIFVIVFLLVFDIDYESYSSGSTLITYLLTPATICLAVPLYEKVDLLKANWKAILVGIFSGVVTSLASVFLLAWIFGYDHTNYVTFLPKSITTAIGMGVSEELGGYVAITVVAIALTGVLGAMMCEQVLKVFKITNPIAKGVAIGSSAHAVGTTKALEIGEIEGAISSLSLVVAGLLTVLLVNVFAGLI